MKKAISLVLTLIVALVITSCASRPESIKSLYISHEQYIDNNCTELSTKMSDARAELAKLSEMQNSKAIVDA